MENFLQNVFLLKEQVSPPQHRCLHTRQHRAVHRYLCNGPDNHKDTEKKIGLSQLTYNSNL
jgi:hypothetical protein